MSEADDQQKNMKVADRTIRNMAMTLASLNIELANAQECLDEARQTLASYEQQIRDLKAELGTKDTDD